ncbi:hypothetical protein IA539_03855 [Gordonia sp. zg691]|nr:hypothetical protein [Gordonia jinghuaiqii]MBD0860344.1 hypothetical protein [Gordonia jinghuaiqii]
MVQFVARWAPYDGGDEEILPTFGVRPAVFYRRMAEGLRANPSLIAARDAARVIEFCARKALGADDRLAR